MKNALKFEVIPDAKRVALIAYTTWALVLIFVLVWAPDAIYLSTGIDTNPAVWTWALQLAATVGLVGRFIKQSAAGRWVRRGVLAAISLAFVAWAAPALAMGGWPDKSEVVQEQVDTGYVAGEPTYDQTAEVLVPHTKQWEGKHPCRDDPALHCSYLDTIASPPLYTVGYGHTETADAGQRLTEGEASALLRRDLRAYWSGVRAGFTDDTVQNRLTPERDAAYASLGYNVGIAGTRKSTATRRLNDGDIAGGCEALTWWNKAGGRVVRGLVNRRSEEHELCMHGLT